MDLIIHEPPYGRDVCFLLGIHADLARWVYKYQLKPNSIAYRGLLVGADTAEEAVEDIYCMLGLRSHTERRRVAAKIIKRLWSCYPEFGPYPILETLEDLEEDLVFHNNYREHACIHQLTVYLLGLYIYAHSDYARRHLRLEINSTLLSGDDADFGEEVDPTDAEFLRRWLIAACTHDVGYVLESSATDPNNPAPRCWPQVQEPLHQLLTLSITKTFPTAKLGDAWELEYLANQLKVTGPILNTADHFESMEILREMDDIAARLHIGRKDDSGPILWKYYQHAMIAASERRERFRDHGITSAFLSNGLFQEFHNKLDKALQPEKNLEPPEFRSRLAEVQARKNGAERSLKAALAAIAIHNVNPDLWRAREDNTGDLAVEIGRGSALEKKGLTSPQFECQFSQAPLVFFLMFCDGLDDWGRPKFARQPRSVHREELLDSDLSLTPDRAPKNSMVFYLRERVNPDGSVLSGKPRFEDFGKRVWRYLDRQDVGRILAFDTMRDPKAAKQVWQIKLDGRPVQPEAKPKGAVGLEPRDRALISNLTREKFDDATILTCELAPEKPQDCALRKQSLLATAELNRVGEAFDDTQAVCHCLDKILDAVNEFRRAIAGGDGPTTLSERNDDLQKEINGLLNVFALPIEGELPDLKAIAQFIENHTSRENEKRAEWAKEFVRLLGIAYGWRSVAERDVNRISTKNYLLRLKDQTEKVQVVLEQILASRTIGTHTVLKETFRTDFAPETLSASFEKARNAFPHCDPKNTHLHIPLPEYTP